MHCTIYTYQMHGNHFTCNHPSTIIYTLELYHHSSLIPKKQNSWTGPSNLVSRTFHLRFRMPAPRISSPAIIGPSQTGGVGSGQHQDPHLPNLSLMKKRWHSDILKALFTYLPTRWVIVGVDDVNFHTWSTTQPSKKFKPGKNMINQQKLRI